MGKRNFPLTLDPNQTTVVPFPTVQSLPKCTSSADTFVPLSKPVDQFGNQIESILPIHRENPPAQPTVVSNVPIKTEPVEKTCTVVRDAEIKKTSPAVVSKVPIEKEVQPDPIDIVNYPIQYTSTSENLDVCIGIEQAKQVLGSAALQSIVSNYAVLDIIPVSQEIEGNEITIATVSKLREISVDELGPITPPKGKSDSDSSSQIQQDAQFSVTCPTESEVVETQKSDSKQSETSSDLSEKILQNPDIEVTFRKLPDLETVNVDIGQKESENIPVSVTDTGNTCESMFSEAME